MSRRKDKSHDRHVPTAESVRRQLEKGNAREALKEAKLCFRLDACGANRELLEETFLVRIQQLHRVQQPTDAKAVLADLIAFGPTSPKVLEAVARLRVLLGETGSNTKAALDADPSLLIEIADRAVLDSKLAVPDYADLMQHVNAVREALLAVETGEDSRAIELLAVISRGSPLADWRLFVRGLSAFYAREDERAEANWSRLEKSRPAARIARTLQLAANMPGSANQSSDIHAADGVRRLALNSEAGPLITLLTELSVEWQQQNRKAFFRTYRLLHQRFARSHENVVRQVVDFVWKWAVRNAAEGVLDDLAAIGPAPEFDPCWNRSRALQAEHPDFPSYLDDVESLWVAYAADLQQLKFLSDADQKISAGLVYQHIAEVFQREAEMLDTGDFDVDEDDAVSLVRTAMKYYAKSIAACPQIETSYLSLVKLYEQNDEIEKAARVMQDLIKDHPDNFEAASWMASYCLSKDNPGQAAGYLRNAQRLRPRDPLIAALTWNQKLTMARGLVLNRQFAAARQEIDDAAGLKPADTDPCALDLFRAGIELKAGNPDGAQPHLDAALAKVEEPASVWMQMSSLAAVFRLARSVRKEFDDRLSEAITNTPTSNTAGHIAGFLVRMRTSQTAYVGRAGHERILIKYLTRADRVSWQPDDLKSVCEFLRYFPAQKRFRGDLLDLGVTMFPAIPHFAYWVGMEEHSRHRTAQGELRMEELLSSAIRNHHAGPAKLTEQELKMAMTTLSMIKDHIEDRNRFGGFMTHNSADHGDMIEVDRDEDEEDFEDDADDDEESGFRMPLGMLNLLEISTEDEGTTDFGIDQNMLDSIERSMPPDIRRNLGKIAKSLGLTEAETTRRMILAMARRMQNTFRQTSRQHEEQSSESRSTSRKPS